MSARRVVPSPSAFLANYPEEIRALAEELRQLVMGLMPDAAERVRPGWSLIGYDVPTSRGPRFFSYVDPRDDHVILGFPRGSQIDDPFGVLEPRGEKGFVMGITYRPGDRIDEDVVMVLLQESASVAASRS